MADISFTATSIKPGANAQKQRGVAGATLTIGLAVYLDTATNTWKIADCTTSATTAAAGGIALSAASSGQPVIVQTGGDLTVSASLSLAAPVLILSEAGAICPSADLANDDYITIIGAASSTTNLKLAFRPTGVVAAGIA